MKNPSIKPKQVAKSLGDIAIEIENIAAASVGEARSLNNAAERLQALCEGFAEDAELLAKARSEVTRQTSASQVNLLPQTN